MSSAHRDGFTLIELLIVIALVFILSTLGMNQYASYRMKGYNTAASSDLLIFKGAMEAYFAEQHSYPD